MRVGVRAGSDSGGAGVSATPGAVAPAAARAASGAAAGVGATCAACAPRSQAGQSPKAAKPIAAAPSAPSSNRRLEAPDAGAPAQTGNARMASGRAAPRASRRVNTL